MCDLLLLINSFGPGFRLHAHNVKKWLTFAIPLPVYQQGSEKLHFLWKNYFSGLSRYRKSAGAKQQMCKSDARNGGQKYDDTYDLLCTLYRTIRRKKELNELCLK